MYKIVNNISLNENVFLLEVEAPLITKKFKPGQFVIVMSYSSSERIPLTIYDIDGDNVKMIYQIVGASTYELSKNKKEVYSIVGPLGNPGLFLKNIDKNILFVAGGVGVAAVYPQLKYLKSLNKKTILIYGVKTKENLILLDELKKIVDEFIIVSDDGTYGNKGFVTDELVKIDKYYDLCVAIGPVKMMDAVCKVSNIKTIVSLNPIMVDGTGMCGSCRINYDGEIKFACVDGPEFYGEKVDFASLIKRMEMYKTFEGKKFLEEQEKDSHKGGCGHCE